MRIAAALLGALILTAAAPGLGAVPLRSLKIGDEAPAFSLKDGRGEVHSFAAHAGRAIVLCYFRPGQSFSESALAGLARVQARFAKADAVFLAADHPDPDGGRLPDKPVPFPVLDDGARELYGSWGLFILPTTIVLDRERRVRAVVASYEDGFEDALTRSLDEVLGIKEKPAPAARLLPPGTDAPEVGLGRRLLDERRPAEALAALEPVLRSTDAACAALLTAADARLRLDRAAEAKSDVERCLAAEPGSPRAALLLGRALTLLRDYGPAEDWLKKGASLTPDAPEARYYLGDLYERTGRKDQALAEYRAGLDRLLGR